MRKCWQCGKDIPEGTGGKMGQYKGAVDMCNECLEKVNAFWDSIKTDQEDYED